MRSSQAVFKYIIENKYTLKYIIYICNLFNCFIMDPHFVTYNRNQQYRLYSRHINDCSYPKIENSYPTIFIIYYYRRVLFIWIYNYYLFT